jgi:hypothetical protein
MIVRIPRNVDDKDLDQSDLFERPLSQLTEMSYSLQRIRLAEISRAIVDRRPLAISSSKGPAYSDVLAVDAELVQFMKDVPSYFMIQVTGQDTLSQNQKPGTVVQAYMLSSLTNVQRCRLHLPYLTSDLADSTYAFSRNACLETARTILQVEKWLQKEDNAFIIIRCKFSGTLYGVFLASIVLLIDFCVNRSQFKSESQIEDRHQELAEAFSILEDAKGESPTAAELLDSLKETLQKHRISLPRRHVTRGSEAALQNESLSTQEQYAPDPDMNAFGLGEWMETEGYWWNDLLGGLDSSFF